MLKRNLFAAVLITFITSGVCAMENIKSKKIVVPELAPLFAAADNNPESDISGLISQKIGADKLSLPLINGKTITFLYVAPKGETPDRIALCTSCDDYSGSLSLVRYKETQLFSGSFECDDPENIKYYFKIITPDRELLKLDPLNKTIFFDKIVKSRPAFTDPSKSTLEIIQNFRGSADTGTGSLIKRDIYILLPPGYRTDSQRKYPVLYMHDGQQLWDSPACAWGGWKVDTITQSLINSGKVEPFIVVGIENTIKRKEEYVGYGAYYKMKDAYNSKLEAESLKLSMQYESFVAKVVKPYIDSNYRTLPDRGNTAIAGSSFGAGVSLKIGFSHPDIFSKIAALSYGHYNPSMRYDWAQKPYWITEYLLDKVIPKNNGSTRLYLDCGTSDLDAEFVVRMKELYEGLKVKGYMEGKDFKYVIDSGAGHNERAWAKRLPEIFIFLFGEALAKIK